VSAWLPRWRDSSIVRRSWRLAVPVAVLILAAGAGSASAATVRTPAPSASRSAPPGTAVQRMVTDCRDAMQSATSSATPMMGGSTGTGMMDGSDAAGMMGGS
jgi:hypothetical protein